jgi:hypothetical protein
MEKKLKDEYFERLNGINKQIVLLRSDYQLEVKRVRIDLGIVEDMPPKIGLYSISKVLELIL